MTTNFDATTPQLKAVKNLFDAYLTRDLYNVKPFISKDYNFQTFPKIAGLPNEEIETHLMRYAPVFSLITKTEVCIQSCF